MNNVVDFPYVSIEKAREIVDAPDLYTQAELQAAGDVLIKHGTDEDFRVVQALYRARVIERLGKLADDRRARRRKEVATTMWGLVVFFLMIIGGVVVSGWIVEQIRAVLS